MANPFMHKPLARLGKLLLSLGDNFPTEHRRSPLLTHFRIGTAAGEWLKIVKKLPLAKPILISAHGPISKLPLKSTSFLSSPPICPAKYVRLEARCSSIQ